MRRLLILFLFSCGIASAQQQPFPGQPAGTNGQLQCNGNGTMGACNAFDLANVLTVQEALTATGLFTAGADVKFSGPNPYFDIRSFGARAVNPNNPPAVPGITVSISSGSSTAVISSPVFVNGDPVVIYGAGVTNTMLTPTTPTVTPSIAQSGTGTGYVVNGPTGSTTYSYVIVARDKNQGLTAASPIGTTSTGAASLGAQTVSLTSCSKSGLVGTCITSSPHGLSIGSMIWISQISDGTFSGWFQVNATPDTSHFSFNTGLTTANAAPSSATGGTVTWFNVNHITWAAVTGAWQYYVYGRVGGSLSLLGVSGTNGTTPHLYFDDFGATMTQATVSLPYFVPLTPPVSATNDSLFTTVSAGGGTTSLTLANAAANNVTNGAILLDAGASILAAAKAAASSGLGSVYIPNSGFNSFVVNSFVNLSNNANGVFSTGVSQAGTLTLNDTIYAQGFYWYGVPFPQLGESGGAFNFDAGPTVNAVHANPGLYSFSTSKIERIYFATAGNGVGVVYDQINPASVLDSEFGTLANQADFVGIGLWAMGVGNNTTFSFDLRRDTFVPSAVNPGSTMTPYFLCQFCGQTFLQNVNTSHRSVYAISSNFIWNGGRMNGGATPPLTISGGNGNLPQASASISNFEMDTLAQPGCAILNAFGSVAGLGCGTGTPSTDGVSRPSIISGDSSQTQTSGQSALITAVAMNSFGNNINVIGVGNGLTSQGQPIGGNIVEVPILAPFPAAPGVAVSSGGSIPFPANIGYTVIFFDINNFPTSPSACATASVTSGNQTVTVTRPSAPLGTTTWAVYRSFTGCTGGPALVNNGIALSQTTYVDTAATIPGNSPPAPSAGISSMTSSGLSAVKLSIVDPNNSGFTASTSFPGALTANRTWKVPDLSGTVAFVDAAQTWSADQSFANTNGIRFFGPNGVNWVKLTGPASNPASNVTWQLPAADSSGVQCISSNGSGVLSFGNCSAGTGTPGGSNKNLQFNSASSFGGASNANYTSATGVLDLSQLANSNNTVTGHRFTDTSPTGNWLTFQNAALNSTLFNVDVAGNMTANSATLTTPLSYANGGTNTGTSFTNNQLVAASGGSLGSLAGTLTGTNPVLTLTGGSASAVPLTLNTAPTPTGDIFDLQINGVKTSWFDSSAFLHTPQTTYTGSGAILISGTEGSCPTPLSGTDILCIGNATTHTIQSSLNGTTFKDNAQFSNSGPSAHGVCLVGTQFPQLNCTSAGTLGQTFISGGPAADGGFGTLGAVGGGTGNTTNTAHSVLLGEGTAAVGFAGPDSTANQPLLSVNATSDPVFGALPLGNSNSVSGILAVVNGGIGANTLAGAGIVTPTGSITVGHCAQWSASTVLQDSGSACGGAGGSPPLSTITAATAGNSINNGTNAQVWNWALTGSTSAFKFGENTAATGAGNILLQASTLSASTALPFQADNNGNGIKVNATGLLTKVGTGGLDYGALTNFPSACGSNLFVTAIGSSLTCTQPSAANLSNGTTGSGSVVLATNPVLPSYFDVTEIAAPSNPASGNERWYANSSTHLLSCLTSGGGSCFPLFQTNGTNNISQGTVNIQNSATTNGITLTATNNSAGNVQLGFSGTLNNSGLSNPSVTVNGTVCTLGSSCSPSGSGGQVNFPIAYPIRETKPGLSLTSAVTVANTGSATSIIGSTFYGQNIVPAGAMVTYAPGIKTLNIHATGTLGTAASLPTLSLTVLLGGQTLSSISVPLLINLASDGWTLDYSITVTSLSTASVGGCVQVTGTSNSALISCASNSNVGSLNFAADQTVDVQATWTPGSSSNTFTVNQLYIRPGQEL